MWTNAALQSLIDEMGERINSISLNNGKYIYIGYPGEGRVQLSDITLATYHGVDVMKIKHTKKTQDSKPLIWEDWITTEFIEGIDIIDASQAEEYRIDPFLLK